jgi:hypothetical protein
MCYGLCVASLEVYLPLILIRFNILETLINSFKEVNMTEIILTVSIMQLLVDIVSLVGSNPIIHNLFEDIAQLAERIAKLPFYKFLIICFEFSDWNFSSRFLFYKKHNPLKNIIFLKYYFSGYRSTSNKLIFSAKTIQMY